MSYADGDGYSGFDVELAQAVCARLGWTLQYQSIANRNAYVELSSGNVDCAWGGMVLEQTDSKDSKNKKMQKMTLTAPYLENQLLLIVRGDSKFRTGSSLKGTTVLLGTDETYMDALSSEEKLMKNFGAAQRATVVMMIDSGVEPGKEQQAEAAIIAELEGLKNGPITQEEVADCRRGLLSSMDALGDSLAALENWYYGQITRGEPRYPPEYGKVLTSAVSLDEVRQTLQSYSYSVCYAVTAEPGTQGKGGSEDVE